MLSGECAGAFTYRTPSSERSASATHRTPSGSGEASATYRTPSSVQGSSETHRTPSSARSEGVTHRTPSSASQASASHRTPSTGQNPSETHRTPASASEQSATHRTPSGDRGASATHRTPSGDRSVSATHRTPAGTRNPGETHRTPTGERSVGATHRTPGGEHSPSEAFRTPAGEYAASGTHRTPSSQRAAERLTQAASATGRQGYEWSAGEGAQNQIGSLQTGLSAHTAHAARRLDAVFGELPPVAAPARGRSVAERSLLGEAPRAKASSAHWAAERLATTGLPKARSGASLIPRMAPVVNDLPVIVSVSTEAEAREVEAKVRRALPSATVRVRQGSPWLSRPTEPARRVSGGGVRSEQGAVAAAAARQALSPVTSSRIAQRLSESSASLPAIEARSTRGVRTNGPVQYAARSAPDQIAIQGGTAWQGASVARTPSGQYIAAAGHTTPATSGRGASVVKTASGQYAAASSVRTPRGEFRGAGSYSTGSSSYSGAGSFRTPAGDRSASAGFRTGSSEYRGAGVSRTGSRAFIGAPTATTLSGEFRGASSATTPAGEFTGARSARTPRGEFSGARRGVGRPMDWAGARVMTTPNSGYRGAFTATAPDGSYLEPGVDAAPAGAWPAQAPARSRGRAPASPRRAGLGATLTGLHRGEAGGLPGWADRATSPVAVRTVTEFVSSLARANNPNQIVEIIMSRGDEVRGSTLLPKPVIQVIEQIQGATRAAPAEREAINTPGTYRGTTTRSSRGSVRGTRSSARVLSGWTGLPVGASATRQAGVGDDKVAKLAKKLRNLIHLAENQNRLSDAQRQVRLSSNDAPSARMGAGGEVGEAEAEEQANVDIAALGREVMELVNRENELRRERRPEDSDGSSWW